MSLVGLTGALPGVRGMYLPLLLRLWVSVALASTAACEMGRQGAGPLLFFFLFFLQSFFFFFFFAFSFSVFF